jgi:hypothetical protein
VASSISSSLKAAEVKSQVPGYPKEDICSSKTETADAMGAGMKHNRRYRSLPATTQTPI